MKKFIGYLLLTLILVSCGSKSGKFRLEGRFRNLNQGEFYIYSNSADNAGPDTIKVSGGRFAYTKDIRQPATLVIIFPNFSVQPVFAEPGATVKVRGDASHLKEMEITGTDDNELMTAFRLATNDLTPPETLKAVDRLVKEHPASPAAMYAIERYVLKQPHPDYAHAQRLTALVAKAGGSNYAARWLDRALRQLSRTGTGNTLPAFTARDTEGKAAGSSTLRGKVGVVSAWASWNYSSQNIQRRLSRLKREYGSRLALVSVCLDARPEDCRRFTERDSVRWPNICDGKMWESPTALRLGLQTASANIVTDSRGRIVARDLQPQALEDRIREMLQQEKAAR